MPGAGGGLALAQDLCRLIDDQSRRAGANSGDLYPRWPSASAESKLSGIVAAPATEVYSGPDAIVDRFEQTIGGEWNVKFVRLDSEDQFTDNDGRVVERGDFAITAGADDSACYAGSYIATWAPQGGGDWALQILSWQDVETALENCK